MTWVHSLYFKQVADTSLARDHLAIMASLVSSKCAFSSAGIILSKHRNALKGDIVEALQFLKCLIHQNLVFCANPSTYFDSDFNEEEVLTQGGSELVPDTEQSLLWDLWLEDDDDTTKG